MKGILSYYFGFLILTIRRVIGGSNESQQPQHPTNQPPYTTGHNPVPMYYNPQYQGNYIFPNNIAPYADPQYAPPVYYPPVLTPATTTNYVFDPNTMPQYLPLSQVPPGQYVLVLPPQPYGAPQYPIPENPYLYNGYAYELSTQDSEIRMNNQRAPLDVSNGVSNDNLKFVRYEEDLLEKHERWLQKLNLEHKDAWKALETRIIEVMVNRIKGRKIFPHNIDGDKYLFMDYTYTGEDVSFIKEIARWEECDKLAISRIDLTLAEAHILLIKIGNSTKKLEKTKKLLLSIYKKVKIRPYSHFDYMYALCILRYKGFSKEYFANSFRENNLEEISNEQQFMKLFHIITLLASEHPRKYMCFCFENIMSSLSFNRKFVLSSKAAFSIAKRLLRLSNSLFTYPIFSESIWVAITLENSIELLKYVKKKTPCDWRLFIRLYFFLTFKFKENKSDKERSLKIHELQESFIKAHDEFFPNVSMSDEEELALSKCAASWISKVTSILGTDYMESERGKEVSKMLLKMKLQSQEGNISEQEEGYLRPWVHLYTTHTSGENSLDYLVSEIEEEGVKSANLIDSLFWQINCIVFQPDYDEKAFKKLFRVVLEGGNTVRQILVLLTGEKFLKDEKVKSEIVEMFDGGNYPGCIYLPYIGDILQAKHPPPKPWSISRFFEEIDSLILINNYTRVLYYLLRMFTYENKKFHDNFLEYATAILKMKMNSSNEWIVKDIFCSLTKNKYYSKELSNNLENICKNMEENEFEENSSKMRKIISSILNNGSPFFQEYESLFNILITLYS